MGEALPLAGARHGLFLCACATRGHRARKFVWRRRSRQLERGSQGVLSMLNTCGVVCVNFFCLAGLECYRTSVSVFTTSLNRYTAPRAPGRSAATSVQARQARHCACIPTVEGRGPPSPIGTVDLRLAPFPTGCLRTGIGG